jgi:mono/diheme cytochrome c family protein
MKRHPVWFASVFGALLLPAFLQTGATAQTTGKINPPLVIASMSGRDLFEFYCAACHGRDGRGGGPVAPSLNVAPADLTGIARRNDGAFPRSQVESFVTSDQDRPLSAHGSRDMPVWGPIFRGLDADATRNRVRIENIVDYIASIQKK